MANAGDVRAGGAYVELGLKDRLAKGFDAAERRLKSFGRRLQNVGMGAMRLGAAAATPLLLGVREFADFETQMARVATMLDAPEKHMDRFRGAIRRMSVEFGESTEALAGGLYDILSASVPAEQALEVLAASARAAKGGMTDTKTAADAITTVLNAYGMAADEAGRVSDVLFQIVRRGKTTFAELAPSIGLVATTAASAGLSLEELGAALAVMTRNGVRTENAVTALQAIVSTFLKPTKEAAEAAARLGFDLGTAALQAEGLEGILGRLGGMQPEDVAEIFPNVRALRGVMPALQDLAGFGDDVAAMGRAAGATNEAYETMARTLGHLAAQAKQAAVVALGELGEALAPMAADAAQELRKWASAAAAFVREHPELVETVAKLAGGMVALGATLWVGGKLIATLGGVAAALKGVGAASAFLLANPPLLAIAAGAALLGGVVYGLAKMEVHMAEMADAEQKRLERGDRLRQQDLDRMRRLRQLADAESLTAAQQQEAAELIAQLEHAYGNLGLAVDEATGAIVGMEGAQARLNDRMREMRTGQVEAALAENRANLQNLLEETEHYASGEAGFFETLGYGAGKAFGTRPDVEGRLRVLRERRTYLMDQLRALRAGETTPETMAGAEGAAGAPSGAGAVAENADADEAARQIKAAQQRLLAARRAALEDRERAEKQAIADRYAEEFRAAKDNAEARHQLFLALQQELANVAARYAEQRAEAERQVTDEIARQRVLAETRPGLGRELALLELEKAQAIRDAAERGLDTARVEELYRLRERVMRAGETARGRERTMTAGTFSPFAEQVLGAAGPKPLDRIAQASEQTAENTGAMKQDLARGGARWG